MGITERKAREKKQRAEMILDAAEAVFFSQGFDQSTMDDVANQAELSKGCVYNYFKNKNELCIGIVTRGVKLVHNMIETAVADCSGSPGTIILAAAKAFLEFSRQHPKYYCALQSYRQHRGGCGADSQYLHLVIDANAEITKIFGKLIAQGQDDGSLRNDISPEETATAFWGDLEGALPGFQLNSESSANLYLKIVNLLVDGLKK
jgi:TetR/AcrR family transcriptional regulator